MSCPYNTEEKSRFIEQKTLDAAEYLG